jgi:hypothetical protein
MKLDNKRRKTRDVAAGIDGLNPKEIEQLDWQHPEFQWRP